VKSIGQLDSTIAKYFVTKNDGGTTYQQSLPMTINLTADYNIWKGLYVNAAASVSPLKELDEAKTHDISHYSLTARYEFKWLSLWVPATYDALGNMHVGAGMRLGPFVVGINDFTPWITEKKMYDIGFYSMLRIPIFKDHKHDRDGDKISNRLDKCPKEPGLLANNGCPEPKPDTDKDGDGVMDKDDKCPDVKGLAELKGCPDGDKDKDGVLDLADKCPDVKGLEILKGCPDGDKDKDGVLDLADKCPDVKGIAALDGCPEPVDKDGDGDGILDKDDKCPAVAGIKELKGCPDTDKDGDGVVDRLDKCPDVKGLEILKGCPDGDKDKDGVLDLADKCPAVKGLPELDGCPDGDKDGDGVLDRKDKCPDVKGFADTEGCPHLEAEELEIINTAFNNLNFKRASDQITPDSYASLYRLATMLNKKTNYILEVNGHTDNTGNPAGNLALSVRRADAVKKYLMTKGIKDERITTHGYGDTRPLNENKTEEDRAKNRRVELLIKAR
jgi:outer membrane protein OmpA-like peptidoglycan-associated protein